MRHSSHHVEPCKVSVPKQRVMTIPVAEISRQNSTLVLWRLGVLTGFPFTGSEPTWQLSTVSWPRWTAVTSALYQSANLDSHTKLEHHFSHHSSTSQILSSLPSPLKNNTDSQHHRRHDHVFRTSAHRGHRTLQ